jgi:hypothetical protein
MKNSKKIISFILLVSGTLLTACEPTDDCKNCEAVTYSISSGNEISRESAIEYCGPSLDEKENSQPISIGDQRIVWECN